MSTKLFSEKENINRLTIDITNKILEVNGRRIDQFPEKAVTVCTVPVKWNLYMIAFDGEEYFFDGHWNRCDKNGTLITDTGDRTKDNDVCATFHQVPVSDGERIEQICILPECSLMVNGRKVLRRPIDRFFVKAGGNAKPFVKIGMETCVDYNFDKKCSQCG